ncbi:MAG: hypothetical protein K6T66_06035 [Peptococcaceae bacterium]|nr:hypothetical protein [Peptococcaceae bacterium]
MYLFEYIVLVLLDCYVYRPKILANPYFDSIMGAVFSDAVYVPAATILIAGLRLNFAWMVLFAAAFMVVEQTFIYLGIYSHHRWNILYTGAGLVINFVLARKWHSLLQRNPVPLAVNMTTHFFAAVLILATISFFSASLLRTHYYTIGWYTDPTRDHVAFTTAFILVVSILMALLVRINAPWCWKYAGAGVFTAMNAIFVRMNILHLASNWLYLVYALVYLSTLVFLRRLDCFMPPYSRPRRR